MRSGPRHVGAEVSHDPALKDLRKCKYLEQIGRIPNRRMIAGLIRLAHLLRRSTNLVDALGPRPRMPSFFRRVLRQSHPQIVVISLARQTPHEKAASELGRAIVTEQPQLVLADLQCSRVFALEFLPD